MLKPSLILVVLIGTGWAVTVTEHIELMRFPPKLVTKETILNDYEILSDEFYRPEDPTRNEVIQLAYVTPWNNKGYDLAKKTAHKLSHVSPVWFQVKPLMKGETLDTCLITGDHDIDRDWINALRGKNSNIKIVPRIIFEDWSRQQMEVLLVNTQFSNKCARVISDFYLRNQFDGLVVELYTQAVVTMQSLEVKTFLVETMEQLAKVFHKSELQVIFTIPAPLDGKMQPNQMIDTDEYSSLLKVADYLQIMTYDFRGPKLTGVAPFEWVESCLFYLDPKRSKKTLLGINWYGYEYTEKHMKPIIGDQFISALKEKPILFYNFDEEAMEHRLYTKDKEVIYYPSLSSLELRINLAHRSDAGIAIWDYGQGLPYFSNLLV
ncbi:unnamed protein product [Caenorhabditis bovis]|uniref:GH18 domain-containing protein n=1 Tax=Caenorhabditis bovis TaxID=2654633 RepID=A0A8S1FCK3_9PELO|nr:unnamed protein product [Caenorhabditis bovis]